MVNKDEYGTHIQCDSKSEISVLFIINHVLLIRIIKVFEKLSKALSKIFNVSQVRERRRRH